MRKKEKAPPPPDEQAYCFLLILIVFFGEIVKLNMNDSVLRGAGWMIFQAPILPPPIVRDDRRAQKTKERLKAPEIARTSPPGKDTITNNIRPSFQRPLGIRGKRPERMRLSTSSAQASTSLKSSRADIRVFRQRRLSAISSDREERTLVERNEGPSMSAGCRGR
jgi:hypothetical protein